MPRRSPTSSAQDQLPVLKDFERAGAHDPFMDDTGTLLTLETRTGSLSIDPRRIAVLVVDMQNDFVSPGGMFDRGGADISGVHAIIRPTSRVLAAARHAGWSIVYLRMGFPTAMLPFVKDIVRDLQVPPYAKRVISSIGDPVSAPDGSASHVGIDDTWNTAIVDELAPQPGDLVITKSHHTGFFETTLDDQLRALDIEVLTFTGCTTSVCVESTLRDAFFRRYRCLLLEDCVAEPIGAHHSRSNHDATIDLVEHVYGWVANSTQFTNLALSQTCIP
jgi:ureidoacrylate peracid hydrolase